MKVSCSYDQWKRKIYTRRLELVSLTPTVSKDFKRSVVSEDSYTYLVLVPFSWSFILIEFSYPRLCFTQTKDITFIRCIYV